MKRALLVFQILCLTAIATAQKLPQDTLKSSHRTFGSSDSLLHVMDGFATTFFVHPSSTLLSAEQLLLPGCTGFTNSVATAKPILFSALPHLGFGYGFGAQGSQILRLDYEQAFTKQFLFNLRYDRWQRVGFMRADELRFSALQLALYQKGRRHELQLSFKNGSDDRQWSGGVQDYAQLGLLSLDLLPVLKESSRTQKNRYEAKIDFSYRIVGDSSSQLAVASSHRYQLLRRIYNEIGNLQDYYPQTYLNSDTCSDVFDQQFWDNRVGLLYKSKALLLHSMLGIKQRSWADPIQNYDTTELNWHNRIEYELAKHQFKHEHAINILGAAQGWSSHTRYQYAVKLFQVEIQHKVTHEWPALMQRSYRSNLTNYSWSNPQKEFFQTLQAAMAYRKKQVSLGLEVNLTSFANVYRFDVNSMTWSAASTFSKGNLWSICPNFSYVLKSWQLHSRYQYVANNAVPFVAKHQASFQLNWKGGVFKNQRLQMNIGANLTYQSAFQALVFLPFIESLDWQATQNGLSQNGFWNLQLHAALEVKTFRFFVNVANLGAFWNDPSLSIVQGYPFAPMQIRLGLTWDFWN